MSIAVYKSVVKPPVDFIDLIRDGTPAPFMIFSRGGAATYVDSDGLIKTAGTNVPRVAHDPVTGERLGYLTEPTRTNACLYSGEVGGTGWVKPGRDSDYTINFATAPDGTLTATRWKPVFVADPGASSQGRMTYRSVNTTAGQWHTFSLYVKPIHAISRYPNPPDTTEADRDLLVGLYADQSGGAAFFNLRTLSIISSPAGTVFKAYPQANGWIRLCFSYPAAGADADNNHFIGFANRTNQTNFDPYPSGNEECYIWGAQIEQNAIYATSYIPTTSAAVSRPGETLRTTDMSKLRLGQELSYYMEWIPRGLTLSSDSSSAVVLSLGNGLSSGFTTLLTYAGRGTSESVGNLTLSSLGTMGEVLQRTAAAMQDGGDNFIPKAINTPANATLLTGTGYAKTSILDKTYLGVGHRVRSTIAGDAYAHVIVKNLRFHFRALTNAELQEITTA